MVMRTNVFLELKSNPLAIFSAALIGEERDEGKEMPTCLSQCSDRLWTPDPRLRRALTATEKFACPYLPFFEGRYIIMR